MSGAGGEGGAGGAVQTLVAKYEQAGVGERNRHDDADAAGGAVQRLQTNYEEGGGITVRHGLAKRNGDANVTDDGIFRLYVGGDIRNIGFRV